MILSRIANSLRRQDWFALFIELLVVVIGLFLAFQVDRWWEERGSRALEADYLERLHEEVSADIEALQYAIDLAESRQGFADFLVATRADPAVARNQPARFVASIMQSAYTYTPSLRRHTFDDLRSTGNIGLIRDDSPRQALYAYYDFDQAQRQYMPLNFMTEFRQFTLAAGILDYATYTSLASEHFVVRPERLDELDDFEIDPAAFESALEKFLDNEELAAWLPKVWGIQEEQLGVHALRMEHARDLLVLLEAARN